MMSRPPNDDERSPASPDQVSRFRWTEYLFPLLVVAVAAWGVWWLVRRTMTQAPDQSPAGELRLPVDTPPAYEIPRSAPRKRGGAGE